MKYNILILSFLMFVTVVNGQERKFLAGASFNIQFPSSDFSELAKTGIGWGVNGEYIATDNFSFVLSSASYSNNSKIPRIGVGGKAIDFKVKSIDLLAGCRYYPNKSFFTTLEAGIRYLKITARIYSAEGNSNVTNESTDYEPKLAINFGAGYRFRLAERSALDFSAVYHILNKYNLNFSAITIRSTLLVYF